MPVKCIIAYFMHETEQIPAVEIMGRPGRSRPEMTGSFVMGDATEAEITEMRQRGLIVREVDTSPSIPAAAGRAALESAIEVFSAQESDVTQKFLVRLRGPMLEQRRSLLRQYGATVAEALPNDYYRVEATLRQPAKTP